MQRKDIAALHHGLRDKPYQANRTLGVLSKMFSLAEDWGLASAGGNPCRFVLRYKEGKRERFLTEDEYRRIGCELCVLEAKGPVPARAAAALRLLMLTGCYSASNFDPMDSNDVNGLARRSAPNTHAE